MSIYEILPALDLTQSIHAKISIRMHRGVKFKISRIPLIGLETRLGIPVNPPPFHGSLPRKSLISRMDWVSCTGDINLPHTPLTPARSPPNKKIKYNKILTYILRSIFLEIPHLELPR